MKKILTLVVTIVLILSCCAFVGCGDSGESSEQTEEQVVFDALKSNVESFYSPESLRVVSARVYDTTNVPDDCLANVFIGKGSLCLITLKAQNKLGGTVSKDYVLFLSTCKSADNNTVYKSTLKDVEEYDISNLSGRAKSYYGGASGAMDAFMAEISGVIGSVKEKGKLVKVADVGEINNKLTEYCQSKGWA